MESLQLSKKSLVFLVLLSILLLGFSYYAYTVRTSVNDNQLEPSAVDSSLSGGRSGYTDLQGNQIELINRKANVTIITSWASWCPTCVTQLQQLARIQTEYADQGVKVIGINRSEPAATAQAFLKAMDIGEEVELVLDSDDYFYSTNNGFDMPETLFFDENGDLVEQARGKLSYELMVRYVEQALVVSDS